jgi:hypothetical protein
MLRSGLPRAEELLESRAVDELQHDEAAVVRLNCTRRCDRLHELVDLDDARVLERTQALRFLSQRHQALASEWVFGASDLDGDVASLLLVMCQKDQKVPLAEQPAGPKPADSLGDYHLPRLARDIGIPRSFAHGRDVGNGRRVRFGRLGP